MLVELFSLWTRCAGALWFLIFLLNIVEDIMRNMRRHEFSMKRMDKQKHHIIEYPLHTVSLRLLPARWETSFCYLRPSHGWHWRLGRCPFRGHEWWRRCDSVHHSCHFGPRRDLTWHRWDSCHSDSSLATSWLGMMLPPSASFVIDVAYPLRTLWGVRVFRESWVTLKQGLRRLVISMTGGDGNKCWRKHGRV